MTRNTDARNTTVKLTPTQRSMFRAVMALSPGAPNALQHGVAWLIEQAYRELVPEGVRVTLDLGYEFHQ